MRNDNGFTLVELVITMVLLGILASVGSNMLSDSFTTTRMVNADVASNTQARYAMERLAREIREIKFDADNANHCISSLASGNTLSFRKNTSGATYNSNCGSNDYSVTVSRTGLGAPYALTLAYAYAAHPPADVSALLSNQLVNNAGSPTPPLLTYLDSNGCSTTLVNSSIGTSNCSTRGGVRFVLITMTVTDPTSGQTTALRTRVALRNTL